MRGVHSGAEDEEENLLSRSFFCKKNPNFFKVKTMKREWKKTPTF